MKAKRRILSMALTMLMLTVCFQFSAFASELEGDSDATGDAQTESATEDETATGTDGTGTATEDETATGTDGTGAGTEDETVTPTETPTETVTPSATATPSATVTPSATATPTETEDETVEDALVAEVETQGVSTVNPTLDEDSAQSVFTQEELDSGEVLEVEITVDEVEEFTEDEQASIDELLATLDDDHVVGLILNIDLTKCVGDTATDLTDLDSAVTITIDIPEDMQGEGKEFVIIRIHDGVAEILVDLDDNDTTVTFETSQFSTYALAEVEATEEVTDSPATGDSSIAAVLVVMMSVSLVGIVLVSRKKFVK